ncbi:MAG: dihydropteroate synthase [Sedimentisphaerales bacterium]|nr:dihydropteroate synthase [Sedimentisphaerales bacterium]
MAGFELNCRGKVLAVDERPLIMGILNVTPDSFSDGGDYLDTAAAVARGLEMVAQGADLLDVGGESTRPGSESLPADEQIRRVAPVLWTLARETQVPLSIDTTLSSVAEAALDAGASIINDVSALRGDSEMAPLAAQAGVPVVLMHMLGTPRIMQKNPEYEDVVAEVRAFLAERMAFAEAAGVPRSQLVVDPGIGFGKTLEHNLLLLQNIESLLSLGTPVLIGPSRKAFIGKVLDVAQPKDRVIGTAAAVAVAVRAGAHILRVHDVQEMRQAADMAAAIRFPSRATRS